MCGFSLGRCAQIIEGLRAPGQSLRCAAETVQV